jgi:hypothetical protein
MLWNLTLSSIGERAASNISERQGTSARTTFGSLFGSLPQSCPSAELREDVRDVDAGRLHAEAGPPADGGAAAAAGVRSATSMRARRASASSSACGPAAPSPTAVARAERSAAAAAAAIAGGQGGLGAAGGYGCPYGMATSWPHLVTPATSWDS